MATVYLADPDAGYRRALGYALRQRGWETEEFESGSELYARAITGDPDLIVMETDLKEMDGFQVFARLQGKRPEEPFPVLFVTDFEHPRVAQICKQRGALGYIGKSGSVDRVVAAVQSFLDEHDPLSERKLPAALAWLQSRGKSGRLEVAADGEVGYVLLHRGRILEARWRLLRGEQALAAFADDLAGARFSFVEGTDEVDLPHAETAPPGAELKTASIAERTDAITGPRKPEDAVGPQPVNVPRKSKTAAMAAGPALKAGPRGALAAARELRLADRKKGEREPGRWVVGVAAGLAVLLAAGVAVAALFPRYVPVRLAGVLSELGIPTGEPEVQGSISDLVRTTESPEPASPVPAEPAIPLQSPEGLRPASSATAGESTSPIEAGSDEESGVALSEEDATTPGLQPPASKSAPEAAPSRQEPEPRADEPSIQRSGPPELARQKEPAAAPARRDSERSPRERPLVIVRPEPPREEPATGIAGRTPEAGEGESTEVAAAPRQDEAGLTARSPGAGAEKEEAAPARVPATSPPRDLKPPGARASEPQPVLVKKPILLQRGAEPYYPPELKAEGVGGSVLLKIRVGTNGRAQQVEVERSSGYESFDQAAVATVGTFLWEPARTASGPTEAWITQAVTFRP